MLSSGMKCYFWDEMLSSGMKCYHLGLNVFIWDEMLSSGANVFFNAVFHNTVTITIFAGIFTTTHNGDRTKHTYTTDSYMFLRPHKQRLCI